MLIFHARLCIAVDAYRLDSTSAPSKIGIQLIRFTTAVAVEWSTGLAAAESADRLTDWLPAADSWSASPPPSPRPNPRNVIDSRAITAAAAAAAGDATTGRFWAMPTRPANPSLPRISLLNYRRASSPTFRRHFFAVNSSSAANQTVITNLCSACYGRCKRCAGCVFAAAHPCCVDAAARIPAPTAVDRYLLAPERPAANPPHATAGVDRWTDIQTGGHQTVT